jgi:hypothetical protein
VLFGVSGSQRGQCSSHHPTQSVKAIPIAGGARRENATFSLPELPRRVIASLCLPFQHSGVMLPVFFEGSKNGRCPGNSLARVSGDSRLCTTELSNCHGGGELKTLVRTLEIERTSQSGQLFQCQMTSRRKTPRKASQSSVLPTKLRHLPVFRGFVSAVCVPLLTFKRQMI